ncbi:MAG TPA: aldolase/citrate lyase family protein [Pirellulales bacterium]|nr:aldolase/citrate lyase family protein [Pirellulales bacterium]
MSLPMNHLHLFRQRLDSGKLCLGPSITLSDPVVTEALSPSVDFFWIDLEHNPTSLESVSAHLIAARAGGAPALVRVPCSDVAWIKRVLDVGADGIIVPQVRSVAEVRSVVSACRYPPMGTRGFGPRRSNNYGREDAQTYLAEANRRVFLAIQIETAEAYHDLDAILDIPGFDSIVIGPNDLSGALGMLGQLDHPQVVEAVSSIASRSRAAGRYVGIGMAPNIEHALRAARQGVQWVQFGGDCGFLIDAAERLYERIRERQEGKA